ncbi:MAG: zf-TFIIB domain-containing protein [Patescibacteria group bacterium]
MKCPLCNGDYDRVDLRTVGGSLVESRRCLQCGGFWFPQPLKDQLDPAAVAQFDAPSPNYSAKSYDLTCPLDGTLLAPADHDVSPHSGQYWSCPDCDGMFFPRGQLALYTQWLSSQQPATANERGFSRTQAVTAVGALFVLSVAVFASLANIDLQAAQAQTLPNSGPNLLTLGMLALTYIAGTILAVLGRRLPIIFMGWGVIIICLFGFSVIIFGP